jgi:hypothetical protein
MPFEPGNNANPNGRPVGSENRLTRKAKHYAEKFLDEIKKAGISEVAATGKMSDYVSLIRAVLPKDHNHKVSGNVDVNHIDTTQLTRKELEDLRAIKKKLK